MYDVNQMIIRFSKEFISPCSRYSIQPFFQIILVEISQCSKELNKFRPPNSSNEPTTFAFSSLYPSSMHLSHIKLCSFSRLKLARAVLSAEKTSPSTWRQLSTGTECTMVHVHRGRMYNEEKAKVVAAVWGTEFKINLFNSVPRYSCFSLG